MLRAFLVGFLCFMQLAFSSNFAIAGDIDLEQLRRQLASTDYEIRKKAIRQLYNVGEKRPLQKEEIELVLPAVKSDPDWRIKTRAIVVLPFAADHEMVMEPLLSALKDRENESSGGGNVPAYACTALATVGDPRALAPMEDWLLYLKTHPGVYGDLTSTLAETAQKRINVLKARMESDKASQ